MLLRAGLRQRAAPRAAPARRRAGRREQVAGSEALADADALATCHGGAVLEAEREQKYTGADGIMSVFSTPDLAHNGAFWLQAQALHFVWRPNARTREYMAGLRAAGRVFQDGGKARAPPARRAPPPTPAALTAHAHDRLIHEQPPYPRTTAGLPGR